MWAMQINLKTAYKAGVEMPNNWDLMNIKLEIIK